MAEKPQYSIESSHTELSPQQRARMREPAVYPARQTAGAIQVVQLAGSPGDRVGISPVRSEKNNG